MAETRLGPVGSYITLTPDYDIELARHIERQDLRTKQGGLFTYIFPRAYRTIELSESWVSSSDKSLVNSWWEAGTQLRFYEDDSYSSYYAVKVTGRKELFTLNVEGFYPTLFAGALTLEEVMDIWDAFLVNHEADGTHKIVTFDVASGRIGIGDTSPQAKLAIRSGVTGVGYNKVRLLDLSDTSSNMVSFQKDTSAGVEGITRFMSTGGAPYTDGYTVFSIDAPYDNPVEATLGLISGIDEVVDLFNMNYGYPATAWGFAYIKGSGYANWKPFRMYRQDGWGGPATELFWITLPQDNIGFRTGEQFGSGSGVIGMQNAITVPSVNASSGGILYVESGHLMWRGGAGTVTTIGSA